ncbi:adenine nucleotide alpha hydrolases-like protein, partial [Backusella circina FSU 941]
NSLYHIVVAVDGSPISKEAIRYALTFCSRLREPYKVEVLHAIPLNPTGTSAFGILDGLDRMNNEDIKQDAKETIKELESYLSSFKENEKAFKLVSKEAFVDSGEIIAAYVNDISPDMLIVGSSNKEGIHRYIMGSVSEYCLHHCNCPVTVIKRGIKGL